MPGYEVILIQTSMSMSIQSDIDASIISNLAYAALVHQEKIFH